MTEQHDKPFLLFLPFIKLSQWWRGRCERIRQEQEARLLPDDYEPWTEEQSRAFLNGTRFYFGDGKPCVHVPVDDEGNSLSWKAFEALGKTEKG